jgi:hypothetical protein
LQIAKPDTKGQQSVQIQAEVLRDWKPSEASGIGRGFALMPDDRATDSKQGKAPRPGRWRDEDLKRAIAVAEEAGLPSYRIEVDVDGIIAIVVPDQKQSGE